MFQTKNMLPSISEYFVGKNVFLTGGTGFLGKVLVEKVLRSCPDVENIYLLIREKKGKNPQERVEQITNLPLFDRLKVEQPNSISQKIKTIYGDVTELNLGISEEDRKLLISKVNIVIHAAASVRFDDPLNTAIIMNTRGTREICNLALEMKKLEVLVHISTTYCQTDKVVIEEKLYPGLADWKKSIEIAEKADPETLNILTAKYTGVMPNTYTFAKNLAEQVVNDLCGGKIPTIIIRPSIVISTFKEPVAGWIDNFNGPVALLVGSGKGILRVALGRHDLSCDFMPVDVCIKGILIALWEKATRKKLEDKLEVTVYNASQNQYETTTMGEVIDIGKRLVDDYPLKNMLWYPSGLMTPSRKLFWIIFLFLHVLPALLVDGLLRLIGEKPMLLKIQRKVFIANMALQFFVLNKWTFLNETASDLENKLLPQDYEKWNYDRTNITPFEYFKHAIIGGRQYLLKEDLKDMEADKKHCYRMKLLHYFVVYGFLSFLLYVLFVKMNILSALWSWFVRYYDNLPA